MSLSSETRALWAMHAADLAIANVLTEQDILTKQQEDTADKIKNIIKKASSLLPNPDVNLIIYEENPQPEETVHTIYNPALNRLYRAFYILEENKYFGETTDAEPADWIDLSLDVLIACKEHAEKMGTMEAEKPLRIVH